MWFEIIICVLAGLGAGLGTGLAGMSAAAVISPMLIVFLGIDPYIAVGIALASDVLASAVSAFTYGKNKQLDIKNGTVMMIFVLIFTLIASYAASFLPKTTMGNFSIYMTVILGLKFIIKPVTTSKNKLESLTKKKRFILSALCGSIVGFICGFVGAGGGMMMLLILTSVLGYELKTAVGTSVFIMTFTALTGATSHFIFGEFSEIFIMVICACSTLIFAQIAAKFGTKASPLLLNRITGIVLTILGVSIILVNYFA